MMTSQTVSSSESPGPDTNELNLIRVAQGGDPEAFASLYESHRERLQRYIYFRVSDHELTEDLTSLVFLKVWENLAGFRSGQTPFAGWLYRIAHNAIIDHYRTRKTFTPLEDVDPLKLSYSDKVDENIDLTVRMQELTEALKELTSTQREVLVLRFLWGLTTQEIARRLHKRQGAVRALQMRGLRRLSQDSGIRTGLRYDW